MFKLLPFAELNALSLVNKSLRTIAEPFLYSTIQWTWQEAHPDAPPPITLLLRTLFSKPQLATYIKNIHLDGYTYRRLELRWKLPKIPISDAELDQPIAFIRGTGVPYGDLWIQELCQGTIDAFVALLLAQLSNVSHLYLANDFTRRSGLIGMVLRSAIYNTADYKLPDFRNLRNVSFLLPKDEDEARDKEIKNTADILPFFYLPELEHLSASIENPAEFTWSTAPIISNLTSLDLTTIRELYLGELLSVTQNLKTLHWHWYYDNGVKDKFTTPVIYLNQFAAAISHVRGTLTDLTISAESGIGGGDQFLPSVKIEGSLHTMADWDMLERLQVPWSFLVGFVQDTTKRLQDVIPRNIEFLSITDDLAFWDIAGGEEWPLWGWTDFAILELLQVWLKDWKACTPHLRGITLLFSWVDFDYNGWTWSPENREQLGELGAQAGIQLEMIELDPESIC